jgi:tetratricopeptide (TPR) repeat protein
MSRSVFVVFVLAVAWVLGSASYFRLRTYDHETDLWQSAVTHGSEDATAHCWLGICLNKDDRLQEAIEQFQIALTLDPKHGFSLNNLGRLLEDTGHPAEAVGYFRRFVSLAPRSSLGYFNLGNALIKSGRAEEGRDCLQTVLELEPTHLKAHFNLAIAEAILGHRLEAITLAEQAIALARAQQKPNAEKQITGWLDQYRATK